MYRRSSYLCVCVLKEMHKITLNEILNTDETLWSMRKTVKPHVFLFS